MMKKVQRITAVLLAAIMVFALASCGGSKREEAASASPSRTAFDAAETPASPLADTPKNFVYPQNEGAIQAFCVGENGEIWAATVNKVLLSYDIAGNVTRGFSIGVALDFLAYKGDVVYGISAYASSIYTIDLLTESVTQMELGYKASQIMNMTVYGENLLLLCRPESVGVPVMLNHLTGRMSFGEQLVEYVIAEQRATIVDMADTPVALAPLENGNVLVLAANAEEYLIELDGTTKRFGAKKVIGTLGAASQIAQDSTTGDLFYRVTASGNSPVKVVFADEPKVSYTIIDDAASSVSGSLFCMDGLLFVLTRQFVVEGDTSLTLNSAIHRQRVEKPRGVTLQIDTTFAGTWGRDQAALWPRWINRYHQETGNAVNIGSQFSNQEQLIAELLSGNNKIDAFIMSIESASAFDWPNNGAFHPISGGLVNQFYDEAFDWIADIFTLPGAEDSFWAIPLDMDSFKLYYNPEKLAAIGLDTTILGSYETLFEAAKAKEPERAFYLGGARYMAYNYLWKFFNSTDEELDFGSAQFRRAVEHTATVMSFLLDPQNSTLTNRLRCENVAVTSSSDSWMINDTTQQVFDINNFDIVAYPNSVDGVDTPNIMQMNIMFINPNSIHKEEMRTLLECIAESHLQPEPANREFPWTPIFLKDQAAYGEVYDISSNLFSRMHLYNSNGSIMKVPEDVFLYVEAFGFGEADVDETIFAIARYMDMLRREKE